MNTAYRDSERTFADFYWNTSEPRPQTRAQGLQPGLSHGFETDHLSGDITELLYVGPNWRVLNEPDKSRRDFGQMQGQLASIEGRLTALENRP